MSAETVRIGQIVERRNETCPDPIADGVTKFVGVDDLDGDDIRVRRWGTAGEDALPPTFRYKFHYGDVLFPTRRPGLRKCAVSDFDGITGEKLLVLCTSDPDRLLPEFVPYLMTLERVREHVIRSQIGSVTPHFRWADLAELEVPLPPPSVQARALPALLAADDAFDRTRELAQVLERLGTALIEDAVQAWVGGARRGAAPVMRLPELLKEPARNGLSPRVNAAGDGKPTLAIGAVRNHQVNTRDHLKYAKVPDSEYQRFLLVPGDVLVVRGNGNRALVGRSGLVQENPLGCFYPDLLIRLRFEESTLNPRFAVLQWNSPTTHARLIARAKSTNGIYKINGQDISAQNLVVPSLAEQHALLAEFADIEAARIEAVERAAKCRSLRRAMQERLFAEEAQCV
jgi:type I restriction enzyme, S subunit